MLSSRWNVIDFFSGCGGMSCGFHLHPDFELIRAVDAQIGKPSSGRGTLQCNSTYALNIGIEPDNIDLAELEPGDLHDRLNLPSGFSSDIFISCAPCTGFTRANPHNHMRDDARNSLVVKSAEFALALRPKIVLMENARELMQGNFSHHYFHFREKLESNGYRVEGRIYRLDRFGLPQIRERCIILAVREDLSLKTLDDLWEGWSVKSESLTVAKALNGLELKDDPVHRYPVFKDEKVTLRMKAIPCNGGSWLDLTRNANTMELLTGAMRANFEAGRTGSYPDVYGRMSWDKPAPTIKRECAHVGNGRYAHPEEDRLCSVREMSVLNGFPRNYEFNGAGLTNLYRHIGDAVPPLISHQLAHLCHWILTGIQPDIQTVLMPNYHLEEEDLEAVPILAETV